MRVKGIEKKLRLIQGLLLLLKKLHAGMDGCGYVAQAKWQSKMVRPQDPVFEQKYAITKQYLNS